MDPAFITPFARSIEEVLATTMQLFVRTGVAHTRAVPALRDEVCAVVEFTGDVRGSVRLRMPRATGERLVQLFIGGPFNEADFADALGELAGMIAGRAKARFPGSFNVHAACPAVVFSPVAHASPAASIFIPCSTDCGDLTIELSLTPRARSYSSAA